MTLKRQWEFVLIIGLEKSLEISFIRLEIIIVRMEEDIIHRLDHGILDWRFGSATASLFSFIDKDTSGSVEEYASL
jgi:hypothetical protein